MDYTEIAGLGNNRYDYALGFIGALGETDITDAEIIAELKLRNINQYVAPSQTTTVSRSTAIKKAVDVTLLKYNMPVSGNLQLSDYYWVLIVGESKALANDYLYGRKTMPGLSGLAGLGHVYRNKALVLSEAQLPDQPGQTGMWIALLGTILTSVGTAVSQYQLQQYYKNLSAMGMPAYNNMTQADYNGAVSYINSLPGYTTDQKALMVRNFNSMLEQGKSESSLPSWFWPVAVGLGAVMVFKMSNKKA